MGGTFEHFQPDCGLIFLNRFILFANSKNMISANKKDLVLLYRSRWWYQNIPDVTFDVDSKSTIKNTIAARNLEIAFENRFSFLPPGGSSLFRRKMRYEQTDFRNTIYAYKWTINRLDLLFRGLSPANEWSPLNFTQKSHSSAQIEPR